MNDVSIACCCVEQNALIVIPIADAVVRKIIDEKKKKINDPLNGMS